MNPFRRPSRRLMLAAPLVLAAVEARGHSYRFGELMIGHAWCLPSAGPTTQAMMPLAVSGGRGDALVGATTPVAEAVALVPDPRRPPVRRWTIAASRPVAMRPDGPHLLLTVLKRALAAGERVPLTLSFEAAGMRQVELWVERAPYAG
jgi:copper(I)-binding protein